MTEPASATSTLRRDWLTWTSLAVAAAGVAVAAWAVGTEWGAVRHGHPAYGLLLAVTAVACVVVIAGTLRPRRQARARWKTVAGVALLIVGLVWIAAMAWLRPSSAIDPDLESDAAVSVDESATMIVLSPASGASSIGVLFQPGALVDARAYVSTLRPLAEAGHTVVIEKQPMGVAFFSLDALDDARATFPDISGWVVGGHSLGGTVASIQADESDQASTAPAVGLLLHASYPPGDMSGTLRTPVASISGTQDGLATPEQIKDTQSDLPSDTEFTVIEGASHAQFGDYGIQGGDKSPEISNEEARQQISAASLSFVASLAP